MKHPTDEEIEKYGKEQFNNWDNPMSNDYADFPKWVWGAKWARDQQPKLKPMPQEYDEPFDWWTAETSFGRYIVRTRVTTPDKKFIDCNDYDHGKQLAQADYERRINELYI